MSEEIPNIYEEIQREPLVLTDQHVRIAAITSMVVVTAAAVGFQYKLYRKDSKRIEKETQKTNIQAVN